MEYENIPDSELISMIQEESEEAKEYLLTKYQYIIDIVIKKYSKMAYYLNIDHNDLYQEALVGFVDATNKYKEDREAGFATFVSLCIERRLQGAILKAGRIKNKIHTESLSLEYSYAKYKQPLMYILSDNNDNNPLENITNEESVRELMNQIEEILSDSEKEVFDLMLNNIDYQSIAILLNKTPKQIDNSIQRIKGKVKNILENRNE